MTPDFGKTATDYATYRQGFPPALFDRLSARGVGVAGQRVVDLGTGTGTIARALTERGCSVIGIDPSAAMLEAARELDPRVDYRVGVAEDTGLPDDSFDLVTAGQCWHWFDRPRAAFEARRILKPGGTLVIAHLDWVELPGNVIDVTERLIEEFAGKDAWVKAALGEAGLYPLWLKDVQAAKFAGIETFSFDVGLSYSHDSWRGRVRASSAIGAGKLTTTTVQRFDARLAEELRAFPDPVAIPHRVFAVISLKPR